MARIQILSPAQRIQLFSLSEEMNQKDIVRYYTLSASDLQIIRKQREEHNQLGFAVQLAIIDSREGLSKWASPYPG